MTSVGGTEENNKREAIVCERCLIKKNKNKIFFETKAGTTGLRGRSCGKRNAASVSKGHARAPIQVPVRKG